MMKVFIPVFVALLYMAVIFASASGKKQNCQPANVTCRNVTGYGKPFGVNFTCPVKAANKTAAAGKPQPVCGMLGLIGSNALVQSFGCKCTFCAAANFYNGSAVLLHKGKCNTTSAALCKTSG